MNGDIASELAEERLLSAALVELAGESRAAVAPWSTWLRVALVLLGITVAFATAWYVRTDRADVAGPAVQEPEPLPPPVRVEGREALEKLLRDAPKTRNLWAVVKPDDLNVVAEFMHLERLLVEQRMADADPSVEPKVGWSLLPLTRLGRLRSVTIGYREGVAVGEIARLAALPGLAEFGLIGTVHTFDAAMGKVLQGMSLRRVSLEAVRVDPAGFAALVGMSDLEHLVLSNCLGLDACDLPRLGRLVKLRSLHLRGVGGQLAAAIAAGNFLGGAPPRVLLSPSVMQALAKLPDLRELVLDSSPVDAAVLAALPQQLERLGLRECLVSADDDFQRCASMPNLRALSCSVPNLITRENATDGFARRQAALCALLDRQPLRELRFLGTVTEAMAASLGKQMALEVLDFHHAGHKDALPLELIATLPKLQRLRLTGATANVDPFPLQKLPALVRVELQHAEPAVLAAFRQVLGDRVVEVPHDY